VSRPSSRRTKRGSTAEHRQNVSTKVHLAAPRFPIHERDCTKSQRPVPKGTAGQQRCACRCASAVCAFRGWRGAAGPWPTAEPTDLPSGRVELSLKETQTYSRRRGCAGRLLRRGGRGRGRGYMNTNGAPDGYKGLCGKVRSARWGQRRRRSTATVLGAVHTCVRGQTKPQPVRHRWGPASRRRRQPTMHRPAPAPCGALCGRPAARESEKMTDFFPRCMYILGDARRIGSPAVTATRRVVREGLHCADNRQAQL
jgi:hypothetical protein